MLQVCARLISHKHLEIEGYNKIKKQIIIMQSQGSCGKFNLIIMNVENYKDNNTK